jgi:hypothetical protein
MMYGKESRFVPRSIQNTVNKAELYYRLSPHRAVNTPQQGFKNPSVSAVWEGIAVCSEFHTKHIKLDHIEAENVPRRKHSSL